MSKLKFIILLLTSVCTVVFSQDADPIEAARQAKLAAEKAAAEAEAATGAAIEAAAAKAAAAAREKVIADRKAEEERKRLEKEAAEAAEVDAAAEAAALEARRKLAAELGLELEEVSEEDVVENTLDSTTIAEMDTSLPVSPLSGFNFGFTGSAGFINGAFITNLPVGGSLVVTTPYGFKLGKNAIDFTVSLVIGSYNAEGNNEKINALLYGLGGNLTLMDFIFTENQVGLIGAGLGARSFSGVSLERLLKRGLNLPVNILVGAEGFLTLEAVKNQDNASYWGGLGIRLDYQF